MKISLSHQHIIPLYLGEDELLSKIGNGDHLAFKVLYTDESTTTATLVEGCVKMRKGDVNHTLKPNQHSQFVAGDFRGRNVNSEDVLTRKEVVFLFEDESLQSIMRKISRWYNVDIEYGEGVDVNRLYGGGLSKYSQVSSVLEMLESTKNINFKLKEGEY